MSAAQLKYVRTIVGFLVFPPMVATHKQAASGAPWPVLSAGFVDWDADGRPLCMGESDSLGIKFREDDTDALRAEWGMTAPAPVVTNDWQPIDTAPDDELVVVFYLQKEGDEESDMHTLDFKEDGYWFYHGESYEHYMAVGGAGAAGPDVVCTGPAEKAPYTHWKRLGTPSDSAPFQPITLTPAMRADAAAIDACCDPFSLEPAEPQL